MLGRGLGAAAVAVVGTARAEPLAPAGEATMDRIRRTGVLRIAALPGEMPFFRKDLTSGEWSGVAIEMAKSIAAAINARVEYVESTYGNSVLDLQANKIDLAFALNPTPQRALAIGFTRAYYRHPFGYVARCDFTPRRWEDLNRPDTRVVSLIGSLSDVLLARYAPKAQVIGAKQGDDAILLMQAGRADCIIYALIQALGVSAKAPMLEQVTLLDGPFVALPSAMGVQTEPDRRWRDFLDSWTDYYTGTRQIGTWMRQGLLQMGVRPDRIPTNADL
jgi:polar amino acid transport system substrate-binding protein